MKTKLKYILPILLLTACTSNRKADEKSAPLYPQPQTVDVNPEGGYTVNPVNGDTIQPLVNSLGDTIITGVPIPATGKVIHPDSVAKPKIVPAIQPDSIFNAHPNRHKIPDDLTVIPVNEDSLTVIPVPEIDENDTSHYLVNSLGDTIPTGVPIPAKGKKVKTIQPQPTKALPPATKDASIADLKYLDVDQGMSSSYVNCVYEDNNGNLWFGTSGGGVSMYNGETFMHYTEKEGLSNNIVWSILEDNNGNLWFGTYGGGVSMYNGETFMHYTEKEGLSNNIVWSILEDKNQEMGIGIFIATEKGLSYITEEKFPNTSTLLSTGKSKKVKYQLNNFGKGDGLKGWDFFLNSAFIDSKNRAWWGGGKGLEMLDLNKFKLSDLIPQPVLKQLDINEQFIDYRNISDSLGNVIEFNGVQKFQNYPLNLELPCDKNHLTFHFAAIDWAAPHKIQYSYLMEGLNTNWSQPTKEPKAEYRNLPYGTYTLKIKAIGESGEWSEPIEYTFTIHPPWWHTWWARIGYGLLALLFVFGTVRWRTAKLKQRQKELETEVKNATKEIREQKTEAEKQKTEAVKQRDEVRKQKEIVEEAHKEITDSIQYAKRIQSAILPPQKLVKEYLPESFILYKPKDVVAGDFYWMENKEGKVLFAAADCTGHGVPGAMVSVVCNNGLNRSVREHDLTEPGKILDKTREIVISEFEKSEEEEVKDGMDIALCSLEGNKLHYAGAHNPLWIIRNGEIIETKADKQPIGKFEKTKPYTTHTFELQKGDSVYIFSDGYADQFGGEKGKKFKAANMKRLLLFVQDKSMEEQRLILDKAFEEWRGKLEQLDDVCMIGVKIT